MCATCPKAVSPSTWKTISSRNTNCCPTAKLLSMSCVAPPKTSISFTSHPTPTAKAKQLRGISAKRLISKIRGASSSTKSLKPPCCARWKRRATSTWIASMRNKRVEYSIASSAINCRRCCRRKSVAACRRVACNRSRCVWFANANARFKRSKSKNIGA